MEMIYECCAGLDVHKNTVDCAVRRTESEGRVDVQVRRFGTMTDDLSEMVEWLKAQKVTHVALESTGVFWKPIYNLLEDHFTVLLVNPQHVHPVPGRKTDVSDCQWLAQLLQFGLLRASFIPPRWQRDLRDLTRERTQLIEEHTRVANRIHKVLEDANIKLGSVATDILGLSGRDIIQGLIDGEQDVNKLAERARGKLRGKIPELRLALEGRVRDHHRFLLGEFLDEWEAIGKRIARIEEEIECRIGPFEYAVALWQTIPGLDRVTASSLVAEIGVDMTQFPCAAHLASWAALCPGNHESAGKRRSGKIRDGNRWLRRTLCQAAWAVTRKKNCYLSAQFKRLAARRGAKRAVMAVAHTLLVIAYTMLKNNRSYQDLGGNYLEQINKDQLQRYFPKRLRRLGLKVTIEPTFRCFSFSRRCA
jgi:transposase